jgi:hypothetical protein
MFALYVGNKMKRTLETIFEMRRFKRESRNKGDYLQLLNLYESIMKANFPDNKWVSKDFYNSIAHDFIWGF